MEDNNEIQTAELERSVIGALCIEPRSARTLCQILKPEDFSLEVGRKIFQTASDSLRNQKVFDAVIAADAITGIIGQREAQEFVKGCMISVPSAASAEYHAKLLHQRSTALRLRSALYDTLMDGESDPSTLAANIISQCRTVIDAEKTGRTVTLSEAMMKMYDGLMNGDRLIRVDTGFPKLDRILKGIWGGNLCIVGARPGVGKSAMALAIAENTAKHGGVVLIYSMEMLADELAERMVARRGIVTLDDLIENQNLDKDKYTKISASCAELERLPIRINDSPHMTVGKIRNEAAATDGLKLIIVDFLSLMQSDKRYEKRYLELGAISRELKNLAAELRIPIITLCQLNREHDDSERPTLNNLRDSGELEQNANKVLLMWNEDKENNRVGVSVAKNRRGKTGAVQMYFDGDHMMFTELDDPLPEKRNSSSSSGKRKYSTKDDDNDVSW